MWMHAGPSAGKITIQVAGCWGAPIPDIAIEVASAPDGRVLVERKMDSSKAEVVAVARGSYLIRSYKRGFFEESRVVEVQDSDVAIRMCLLVAPVEGVEIPKTKVRGRVLPRPNQALSVRITGMYSDAEVDVRVNDDGSFTVDSLRPGRYLARLLRGGVVLQSKQFDAPYFKEAPLEFSLN